MLSRIDACLARDERGAVMVVFAVVLPVILLISVISVDVGNWFVHKKRLQTLVDAAALAAGNEFTGCFQDTVGRNAAIATEALKFAGDRNRDANTQNVQEQEASPGDVHVVLNSKSYWDTGDPVDGSSPGTGRGDWTWYPPYTVSDDSKPCQRAAIDVKATDDKVPLLFGFIPVAASPHAYARVEIKKVLDVSGMLPFAIPEVNAAKVGALIVNEDVAATDANSVRGRGWLNSTTSPPAALSGWEVYDGDLIGVNLNGNENFGVIIVTSRDPLASLTGSLSTICNQNPVQVTCYGKPFGNQSGISFIHSYGGAAGGINPPAIRDVQLFGGCGGDLAAPYFNLTADNGADPPSCTLQLQAKIDFGVTGDPRAPNRPCAEVTGPSGPLSWSAGGLGGTLGTWSGTVTINPNGGRHVVNLNWRTDRAGPCGGQTWNGTFPRVAVPYAARPTLSPAASGPVEYLWVANNDPPFGAANSINGTASANLHVTVGLTPQLRDANPLDPPIRLRYASVSGSQNQAVDCDKNINFRDEIVNGCQNPYRENLRNGDCSNYNSGNLPRPAIAPLPGDDCVRVESGDKTGQIRSALDERFGRNGGPTCKTLNHWPKNAGDPMPDLDSDPRVVTLFITDENTFGGSGSDIYPIRRFANFYITAADGLECPGDDPSTVRRADVWGHWLTYVTPDPNATPSDALCAFDDAGTCIAVLVE